MSNGLYEEILQRSKTIRDYNELLQKADENTPSYREKLEVGKTICSATIQMIGNYRSIVSTKIAELRRDELDKVRTEAQKLEKIINNKLASV